jgi:hypothetical protein
VSVRFSVRPIKTKRFWWNLVCRVLFKWIYVSKSFRTGLLERELQMVQPSATRCSCIAILWVSLVSFVAITLCVVSQRVFIVVISLWLSPETFGYTLVHIFLPWGRCHLHSSPTLYGFAELCLVSSHCETWIIQKVAVQRLAFRNREIPGPNIDPEVAYRDLFSWAFSVQRMCWHSTLKYAATAPFHVINSHFPIRCSITHESEKPTNLSHSTALVHSCSYTRGGWGVRCGKIMFTVLHHDAFDTSEQFEFIGLRQYLKTGLTYSLLDRPTSRFIVTFYVPFAVGI